MGASDKPTIEGFVERLLEENHIKVNETITVTNTLRKATDGMTAEEKAIVIRSLHEKLDASSSDLITPQGLNFASLEKTVLNVTSKIIEQKEEIKSKQEQEKQAIDVLIEDLKNDSALNEEIEKVFNGKDERIKENIESLGKNLYSYFYDGNNPNISSERQEEDARNMEQVSELEEITKIYIEKYKKLGYSDEK